MIPVHQLDDKTCLLALEIPPAAIVLLQGLFETYEGIATVRSIDTNLGIISVITTPDCLPDCLQILESAKEILNWRVCANLPPGALDFLK